MISLTGLRTLIAVVEEGGIRTASERLLRTPSAVSMTLKQLEKEVGGPLFVEERKNRLSPLGYRVLDEAQLLLAHYDRSNAAILAFVKNKAGRCDVASVPSVATTFLPEAIYDVKKHMQSLMISIRDMDSASVIDAVDKGTVELGFCTLDQTRKNIRFEALFTERLDLVCPKNHPLASQKRGILWEDIALHEFIMNGSFNMQLPSQLLQTLKQSELEARNVASILAMVRAGLGISVLPHLCRPLHDPDIVFKPIKEKSAQRTVGWVVALDRKLQPATEHLLNSVKQIIKRGSLKYEYELEQTLTNTERS